MTSQNQSNNMEEVSEIDGLYCSLCYHSLHNSSYKICQHPLIEVPLCILCLDSINEVFNSGIDLDDICCWCGEGGDLLGCDKCDHFFCQDCISNNLGEDELKNVVGSSSWKCYVCDQSSFAKFHNALKVGENISIFNESKVEAEGASEEQAAIERLNVMVAETMLASANLDTENLAAKKKEFEDAFANKELEHDSNCCQTSDEELDLYRAFWQRHYDIVLRQEADLFEQVSFYGYNPLELPCYKNKEANLGLSDEDYAKVKFGDITTPDVEIATRKKKNGSISATSAVEKEEYVEEVVEEDTEGVLEMLTQMAKTDPTVVKYGSKPDVEIDRYPPSFEKVMPVGVLKALYYGSVRSCEIQELIQKFSVPPHIVLIMSVADCNHEGCTNHWELAKRVHPSVRKALYELSSTVDQAIICSHYKLGDEYCSITDFGDAEDICEIYTETHHGVNVHKNELNPKNLNELTILEQESAQSKLSQKQLTAVVRSRKSKSNDISNDVLQLQVKTVVSFEKEDADEIKLHRQRVVVSSGVKFSSADDKLEEAHRKVKVRTRNALIGDSNASDAATVAFADEAVIKNKPPTTKSKRRRVLVTVYSSDSSSGSDDEIEIDGEEVAPLDEDKKNAMDISEDWQDVVVIDESDDEVADTDTVEGYWDTTEMLEMEERLSQQQATASSISKKDRSLRNASVTKKSKAKVVDLTMSDDEAEFEVDDSDESGSECNSSSESSKSLSSDGSDESTSGSDVKRFGGTDDDLLEDMEFTQRKTRQSVSTGGGRLKKNKVTHGGDSSDGSDLESPLLNRKKESIGSISTTPASAGRSAFDLMMKKTPAKPTLPDVITKAGSNSFNVSGKSFDIFNRKPLIRISREELLENQFKVSEGSSFALNASAKSADLDLVCIPLDLVDKLKDHQKEGLQFLWSNSMEASFKQLHPKKDGSGGRNAKDHGCLLAHCMGLGKTFSIITFSITLLCNPAVTSVIDPYQPIEDKPPAGENSSSNTTKDVTKTPDSEAEPRKKPLIKCILIIVPLVTVENWIIEFKKWTPSELQPLFHVWYIDANLSVKDRIARLKKWHTEGGVMVIGYTMFRTMTNRSNKSTEEEDTETGGDASTGMFNRKKPKVKYSADVLTCRKYLLEPGADLVVADEAHQLSNRKSALSIVFSQMRTKRRIALTGSPLQNNLVEYYTMVEWVKKGHLAHSEARFKELFVAPITLGEAAGAHKYDVQQMRKKVFVLNKKLSTIVHRKDFSILIQTLKMKRQYVLCIKMTTFQQYLYRLFLVQIKNVFGKASLFKTYQTLLRLWNHPVCTVAHFIYEKERLALEAAKESNNGKNKSTKPKTPLYIRDMVRELSPTFNHFKVHGTRLLAEMEAASKEIESKILKRSEDIEEFPVDDDDDQNSDDGDVDVDRDDYENTKDTSSSAVKRPLSRNSLDEVGSAVSDNGCSSNERVKKSRTDSTLDLSDKSDSGTPLGVHGRASEALEEEFASPGDKLISSATTPIAAAVSDNRGIAFNLLSSMDSAKDDKQSAEVSSISAKPPLAPTVADSLTQGAAQESSKTMALDWWRRALVADANAAVKSPKDDSVVDLTADCDDDWAMGSNSATEISTEPMSEMDLLQLSNKLITFLSLLVLSIQAGDKVLLFSQSLYTLNMVEVFLRMKNWGDIILMKNGESTVDRNERSKFSNWINEREYMRIDGSTKDRQRLIDRFNGSDRYKLFMVCTRAGNMGINLYTANRVVIFDSSWNPVHDLQAISRSYRYGQKKEVFVYRMVAAGSMEEVIYKRQMLKQALAARVVDAQMPDNQEEGGELMDFEHRDDKTAGVKLSDTVNQDRVLLQFVDQHSSVLSYIEDQEVLLEDNVEAHLNEEEQKAAEAEYEKEIARENRLNQPYVPPSVISAPVTGVSGASASITGFYDPQERASDFARAYQRAVDLLANRVMEPGKTPQSMALEIARRYVDDKAVKKRQEAIAMQGLPARPTVIPSSSATTTFPASAQVVVTPSVATASAVSVTQGATPTSESNTQLRSVVAPATLTTNVDPVEAAKRQADYERVYRRTIEKVPATSIQQGMTVHQVAEQIAKDYVLKKARERAEGGSVSSDGVSNASI